MNYADYFLEGLTAAKEGKPKSDNPHTNGIAPYYLEKQYAWNDGWDDFQDDGSDGEVGYEAE